MIYSFIRYSNTRLFIQNFRSPPYKLSLNLLATSSNGKTVTSTEARRNASSDGWLAHSSHSHYSLAHSLLTTHSLLTMAVRLVCFQLACALVALLSHAAPDAVRSLPGWEGPLPSAHYSGFLDFSDPITRETRNALLALTLRNECSSSR